MVSQRGGCYQPVLAFSGATVHFAFSKSGRPLSHFAQVYGPASLVVCALGDLEITVELLVQVDQLVQLLETSVFTHLRLQLLEPGDHPALLKTLYGLLLLLPQSSAWATLSARLQCVPTLHTLQPSAASPLAVAPPDPRFNGADLVATFRAVQERRQRSAAATLPATQS